MALKWDYETCKKIAKNCETRKELKEKFYQVHYKIYKKKWYELLEHMERDVSKSERCVYAYVFCDGHIYIGITCNLEKRDKNHRRHGVVFEYSVKAGVEIPKPLVLSEYINYDDATKIEIKLIEYFREKVKNKLLNKDKGGGLGSWGAKIDSIEVCVENAKKCKTIEEFRKKFYSSYKLYKSDAHAEYEVSKYLPTKKRVIVSFSSDGKYFKTFFGKKEAENVCKTKYVSDSCREHYYTGGYCFYFYNDWEMIGKPLEIKSQSEKNKDGHVSTISKRRLLYEKKGNPHKGAKRSMLTIMKLSKPLVMTDLSNNVIDVVYGASFAAKKYNIPGLLKSVCKCKNKINKSAYGYRWYDLNFYNLTFNTNLTINYNEKNYSKQP